MRATWLLVVFILALVGLGACSGDGDSPSDRFDVPELDPDLIARARTDSTARASIPLAYVDGEPIEAGILETQLHLLLKESTRKDFNRNPDVLQIALSGILDQIILAKKAEELGITLSKAEEHELYLTRIRMISDRYLKTEVKEMATPSEEEALEWFNRNQEGYLNPEQVSSRHILVDSEARAKELMDLVVGGTDFKELCRQYSLDELTREIGGNQGWLYPSREVLGVGKDAAYVEKAGTLEVDQLCVYESKLGWHVIQVTRVKGGDLQPFDEVKESIRIGMGQKNWPATYNQVCLDLRARYGVTMSPEGIGAYAQVEDTVQRTFAMAQSQDEPKGKIELWRKIVFDYPKSAFAPEAQFMIAYTYLRDVHDHWEANRHIGRLTKRYPGTRWAKAGQYLLDKYVNPDAERSYSSHSHDEYGGHEYEDLDILEPHQILKIVEEDSR